MNMLFLVFINLSILKLPIRRKKWRTGVFGVLKCGEACETLEILNKSVFFVEN